MAEFTGIRQSILSSEARIYGAARRRFAGGRLDESGGLRGECVGLCAVAWEGSPVYRSRRYYKRIYLLGS